MFKTFKDENAEKMRELAKSIPQATERFTSAGETSLNKSEHPIASQFFIQPEVSVRALDTSTLLDELGGDAAARRWKETMKGLYPSIPAMWDVPRPGNLATGSPDVMDMSVGNMSSHGFGRSGESGPLTKGTLAERVSRALRANAIARAAVALGTR